MRPRPAEKSNAAASHPPTLTKRKHLNPTQQQSKVSQINNDVARYARSVSVCIATLALLATLVARLRSLLDRVATLLRYYARL